MRRDEQVSEQSRNYRRRINEMLPIISEEMGLSQDLVLNEQGVCFLQYAHKFLIVFEVPSQGDCLFLYTLLSRMDTVDHRILQKALELNYLQQATQGACISLDPNTEDGVLELNLSYSIPVAGMDIDEFCCLVQNFCIATQQLALQLDIH